MVLVGTSFLSRVIKATGLDIENLMPIFPAFLLTNAVSSQMFDIPKLNSDVHP
jgi:hypothetical protein